MIGNATIPTKAATTSKAANAPKKRIFLRGSGFVALATTGMTVSAATETGRLTRRTLIERYSNASRDITGEKFKFSKSRVQLLRDWGCG
jgi:hypothetical protein